MNYNQQSDMVNQPAGIGWWDMQKMSMLSTYGGSKVWNSYGQGKGLPWSGLSGFRRLALGNQAFGASRGPSFSVLGSVGQYAADVAGKGNEFKTGGLFGKGGILGAEKTGILGKFIGGMKEGPFGKYKMPYKRKFSTLVQNEVDSIRRLGKVAGARGIAEKNVTEMLKAAEGEVRLAVGGIQTSKRQAFAGLRGKLPAQRSSIVAKVYGEAGAKTMSKASRLRLLGSVGKGAGALLWMKFAYDVTKPIVGAAFDTASVAAEEMEKRLGALTNNRIEFGGEIPGGFYSGQASTERQRALQAIQSSRINARTAIGNEGNLQHTGNTW